MRLVHHYYHYRSCAVRFRLAAVWFFLFLPHAALRLVRWFIGLVHYTAGLKRHARRTVACFTRFPSLRSVRFLRSFIVKFGLQFVVTIPALPLTFSTPVPYSRIVPFLSVPLLRLTYRSLRTLGFACVAFYLPTPYVLPSLPVLVYHYVPVLRSTYVPFTVL